jgi:hypothetical protein
MDWFEKLFGFREGDYEFTRQQFEVEGSRLRSRVNGRSYGIGELELVSLQTLRERVRDGHARPGRLRTQIVRGDVRQMHLDPEYTGALFQVASQFNLLEMVGPEVTPVHGVTRYEGDKTQGPACAIAAGAATVYRNYFAPVDGELGQTRHRQLDGLADLGVSLRDALGKPATPLWEMRNGYALCTLEGLKAIDGLLARLDDAALNDLRGRLRVGLHRRSRSRTQGRNLAPSCRRPFAQRCLSGTATSPESTGRVSQRWCSRRPTRPRSWRQLKTPGSGARTSCCSLALAAAPSETTTSRFTVP